MQHPMTKTQVKRLSYRGIHHVKENILYYTVDHQSNALNKWAKQCIKACVYTRLTH